MRLTCPNCAAQYEVGDDLIPSGGRDVKCSNCGTTWFQEAPGQVVGPSESLPPPPAFDPETDDEDAEAPDADYDDDEDDDEEFDRGVVQTPVGQRRPQTGQHVLDILRAERAREDRLRRAEPGDDDDTPTGASDRAAAPQPASDLDLREQAAMERARMAAAADLARARDPFRSGRGSRIPEDAPDVSDTARSGNDLQAEMPPPPPMEAPAEDPFERWGNATPAVPPGRPARRELLPDIEEINSSLRPDERYDGRKDDDRFVTQRAPKRSSRGGGGFRLGFVSASVVVLAFLGIYAFAAEIAEAVPQIAPQLAACVEWVDAQLMAFATGVERLTDRILPAR